MRGEVCGVDEGGLVVVGEGEGGMCRKMTSGGSGGGGGG
jgi:hypothetical protein